MPDTLAQRALACTGCHGPQGRSSPQGYVPRIAGKPEAYLYQQLLAFREGRRPHEAMARLLTPLTDDYLRTLAGHFASLEVAYLPVAQRPATPAALQTGQRLVQQGDPSRQLPACVACHGSALMGWRRPSQGCWACRKTMWWGSWGPGGPARAAPVSRIAWPISSGPCRRKRLRPLPHG
ncbi:c-type cytochrome [Ideonella paludis]|uniref:c-type cytochrome n=1 Tax=Ideonella paludis TaxID=1233411 RepID=UPI00362F8206